jgi:hypothetical protein
VECDPLTDTTELSGLFSDRLEFTTDKKDFDFQVTLDELMPKYECFLLASYQSVRLMIHKRVTDNRVICRQLHHGSGWLIVAPSVSVETVVHEKGFEVGQNIRQAADFNDIGEVAERLNAPVLKTGSPLRGS